MSAGAQSVVMTSAIAAASGTAVLQSAMSAAIARFVDGSGLVAGNVVDLGDGPVGEQVVLAPGQGPLLTAAQGRRLSRRTGKKGPYGSRLYEFMVDVARLQVWR